MDATPGSRSFTVTGDAYDLFMGRYGRALAPVFADSAGVVPGLYALDVGSGPGALTGELVARLGGANAVSACDPAPRFVAECARRHPGVDVRVGAAQAIPFPDASFDRVLAQLVLPFVTDPPAATAEFRRVARPGGGAEAAAAMPRPIEGQAVDPVTLEAVDELVIAPLVS